MAQQIIDVGAAPDDGEGDPIRTAFIKTNDNFTELYAGGASTNIANGTSNVSIASSANITVGVTGNTITTFASSGVYTNGLISASGNVQAGNLRSTGGISSAGNVVSSAGFRTTNIISAAGNIVTAGYFVGTFAGNITGNITVAGSNTQVIFNNEGNAGATAGFTFDSGDNTVATTGRFSAQGNVIGGNVLSDAIVTAVGNITGGNILTSGLVSASGTITSVANITGGNILTAGLVSATGNVTGNYILGNGSQLSGMPAVYGNSNVAAFLQAFGSNSLSTTGNVTSNNISASGIAVIAGNVSASYYFGTGIQLTGDFSAGNLDTGGRISAVGNVIGGNLVTTGLITATGTITSAANVIGGNLTTAGQISATGNINSAASISAVGNVHAAALSVSAGILNLAANGVSNIGNSSGYFNTVFALATSAQYADLAEMYTADQPLGPGTVVSFGGSAEVCRSHIDSDRRVAGVISTRPALQMNTGLQGQHVVPVALTGRVPCSVTGSVSRGDMMVSAGDGSARADAEPAMGTVIGKALQDFSGDSGVIEIVVGRL